MCPNEAAADYGGGGGGGGFATRAPPPGRGLNMAALPPVKCYRCGGPNHMARYVTPGSSRRTHADSSLHTQGLLGSAVRRLGGHERREARRQELL